MASSIGVAPFPALLIACVSVSVFLMLAWKDAHPLFLYHSRERDVLLEGAEFHGALAVNDALTKHTRHIAWEQVHGQETVAVAPGDGALYVAPENGWLLRVDPETQDVTNVTFIGGRVLGLAFATPDTIVACDVAKGLISIHLPSRRIEVLATISDDGLPILYCDDVDVDGDGNVFFTDAMDVAPWRVSKPGGPKWTTMQLALLDFFRGYGTGRLMVYNASTHTVHTLIDGLHFANGVAVADDGSFVCVAETMNTRIVRFWLKGPHRGFKEIFTELPVPIDGISRASDGGFWLAIPAPVTFLQLLASRYPIIRYITGNLPPQLWPKGPRYGIVVKVDRNGVPEYSMHDATGATVHFVSGVTEHGGKLYLGQLHGHSIPVVDIASAKDRALAAAAA